MTTCRRGAALRASGIGIMARTCIGAKTCSRRRRGFKGGVQNRRGLRPNSSINATSQFQNVIKVRGVSHGDMHAVILREPIHEDGLLDGVAQIRDLRGQQQEIVDIRAEISSLHSERGETRH